MASAVERERHLSMTASDRSVSRLLTALNRRLRLHLWFPHLPLFLAVLFLSLLELRPLAEKVLAGGFSLQGVMSLSMAVLLDFVDGAPRVIAGVFLAAMSIGLLLRSRLAWIISAMVIVVDLAGYLLAGPVQLPGLAYYNAALLTGLILAHRSFQRSSVAAASLFALTSFLMLIVYSVMGAYIMGTEFAPPISDLTTALYFSIVTMSTVGYGDIVPVTPETRLFVVSVIIIGITVFATSLSTLLIPLISRKLDRLLHPQGGSMKYTNHYIIVSQSALALNSAKKLLERGNKVLFIVNTQPEHPIEETELIVGDATDTDVLARANGKDAKAILALCDDDSTNVFVVLAAKELDGSVKTVAVFSDARNMARVKLVHPDLVISPTILGGELLAMALSGEKLQGEHLIDRLLQFDT